MFPLLIRKRLSIMKQRGGIETRFKPQYGDKAMSRKPIGVLLPMELDAFVRSLPNKSEWVRAAIAEKYEREVKSNSD